MAHKFYFRCRSNPKGPILVLNTYSEAKEMKSHPDYDRVDELGLPVVDEEDAIGEQTIPVQRESKPTEPKRRR